MTDEQHLVRASSTGTEAASRIDDVGIATGLERLAFSTLHVAPGESVTIRCDTDTEAFLYVQSGQGRVHSDGTDITCATGDFVAFNSPSALQTVSNTSAELLVCLLGGEGDTTARLSSPEQ